MRRPCGLLFILLTLLLAAVGAAPSFAGNGGDPATACAAAIASEEQRSAIPRHLLSAIALAESGRWDDRHKATVAWPWTIMAEGNGQYFPTKADALAAARALRARGVRNMDVGCMQINMMYHGEHFASLEEAFEPAANVAYAGRFLRDLYAELGSWHEAAGRYHSATPQYNIPYKQKIARLWEEQRESGGMALAGLPPVADPTVSTASSRAARTNGRHGDYGTGAVSTGVQTAGRAIVPVDYDRTTRLTEAWRARKGRSLTQVAPVSARTSGQARAGIRSGAGAATFAAKRREYLDTWRENRRTLAMN